YDSVDAPLWYVLRCYEQAPRDPGLFEKMSEVVLSYYHETGHPFFMDEDGLVTIRPGPQALTWMDARVFEGPVTPRWGKPVEINALWWNALSALRVVCRLQNKKEVRQGEWSFSLRALDDLIEKVRVSLQQFVGEDYLADRIFEGRPICEVRPNAVIALSLPFDFVDQTVMERVWKRAKKELLTPYGLRSLSPEDPSFKQRYLGNQRQRDLTYHQGTVWAFLLLPFARLTWKALKGTHSTTDLVRELTSLVWELRHEFLRGETASVAEIWDGMDPKIPKGCPAQAWSVFALLEIEQMILRRKLFP
ncbi:MAG: amylo-alpha-1,6-glucosidase, partial [bacterium]|nr:amylo-alpha-1,6-glucosidase [bacterium]